jgi:cell wall-associated NlpC family hydrolase
VFRRTKSILALALLLSSASVAIAEPLWPADVDRLREYASLFENSPYHFGARRPASEDCSSFIQKVFASAGIELPRSSSEQAKDPRFVDVPLEMLRAGDLVFFRNTWRRGVSHVAFMLDGETMIHSSPSHGKVLRSTLTPRHPLWRKIHSVRRLAPSVYDDTLRPRFSWEEKS